MRGFVIVALVLTSLTGCQTWISGDPFTPGRSFQHLPDAVPGPVSAIGQAYPAVPERTAAGHEASSPCVPCVPTGYGPVTVPSPPTSAPPQPVSAQPVPANPVAPLAPSRPPVQMTRLTIANVHRETVTVYKVQDGELRFVLRVGEGDAVDVPVTAGEKMSATYSAAPHCANYTTRGNDGEIWLLRPAPSSPNGSGCGVVARPTFPRNTSN